MNWQELIKPLFQLLFSQSNLLNLTETKALHFSKEILQQIRRIILLMSVTLGGLLLFLLGMHFLVLRLLDQLDRGEFIITPSIVFLLIFLTLCIASIVYATRVNTWSKTFSEKNPTEEQLPPKARVDFAPIESAISLYILDIVKEREWKRTQSSPSPESQKNESSQSSNQ